MLTHHRSYNNIDTDTEHTTTDITVLNTTLDKILLALFLWYWLC